MSPKIKDSNKTTENKKSIITNEYQLNNKFDMMNIHKDVQSNFRKKLDKNFKLESIDIIMQKLRQKRELKKK